MQLNEKQEYIIKTTSSKIIVIAVPGSGKTTVLLAKIKKLLESGVSPESILAVTFTNKAAKQMKERLKTDVESETIDKLTIKTSHSFAFDIVRNFRTNIGYYSDNITIYDEQDKKDIIENIIKNTLHLDFGYKKYLKGSKYNNIIDKEYKDTIIKYNALDYDLLLPTANWILKNNDAAKKKFQYQYVFYDEFQDIASEEWEMISLLNPENLFVVGDPDQNIYTFRGTDIKYILDFEKTYFAEKIILDYNYRSGKNVTNIANKVIVNNQTRIAKDIISKKENSGETKRLYDISEIADIIKNNSGKWNDFAILTRTNKFAEIMSSMLKLNDIPVQLVGSSYWQNKEIKYLINGMRLIYNKKDDMAFSNLFHGLNKLKLYAIENDCSLWEANEKIDLFSIDEFNYETDSVQDALNNIFSNSEYIKSLTEQNLDTRLENVKQFYNEISLLAPNDDWDSFIENIANPMMFVEKYDPNKDEVTIMTIHGSKGLEFENVIIAGVEDKYFPLPYSDIEEERRLFYVGITRAKTNLYIQARKNEESIFVKECEL